jgi:hypothetical protein
MLGSYRSSVIAVSRSWSVSPDRLLCWPARPRRLPARRPWSRSRPEDVRTYRRDGKFPDGATLVAVFSCYEATSLTTNPLETCQ